jgi:hypothetical protein
MFQKHKEAKLREQHDAELQAFVLTLIDPDGTLSEENESKFLAYLGEHGYAGEGGVVTSGNLPEEVVNEVGLAMARAGRFAPCAATLLLKPGETAYTEVVANLMKEVTDREFHGGSRGVSVPLGHGVRYRTSSTRGHMVAVGTHWQPADSGVLTVTDRRVVYHGGRKTLEFLYSKLATLNAYSDAIDLGVTNRQTTSTLSVDDPNYVSGMIHAAYEHNSA